MNMLKQLPGRLIEMIKEIENRHSVRSYEDIPLSLDIKNKLNERINEINEQNSLHFQLVYDEPKAFKGLMAHYGGFKNVSNYIALIGPKYRTPLYSLIY